MSTGAARRLSRQDLSDDPAEGFSLNREAIAPTDALHFSMSLPVAALLSRTRVAANKGECELYKTSQHFDGTAQNPKWLGYA